MEISRDILVLHVLFSDESGRQMSHTCTLRMSWMCKYWSGRRPPAPLRLMSTITTIFSPHRELRPRQRPPTTTDPDLRRQLRPPAFSRERCHRPTPIGRRPPPGLRSLAAATSPLKFGRLPSPPAGTPHRLVSPRITAMAAGGGRASVAWAADGGRRWQPERVGAGDGRQWLQMGKGTQSRGGRPPAPAAAGGAGRGSRWDPAGAGEKAGAGRYVVCANHAGVWCR